MSDPFKSLGFLILLAAAFVLLVGIWTYSFNSTQGHLVLNEIRRTGAIAGYNNTPRGHSAAKTQEMIVKYTYYIENKEFISSRIGMGYRQWTLSPLGEMHWGNENKFSGTITVFYSPYFPEISALHRGVDWVITFSLLLLGIGLINFIKLMPNQPFKRDDQGRPLI